MIIIKMLSRAVFLVVGIILCIYGYLFYKNNHHVEKPAIAEINQSYKLAVTWLLENKETILHDRNPILWWMLARAAENTDDDSLRTLLAEFQSTSTVVEQNSVGQVFFEPEKYWGHNFPAFSYQTYSPYQKYFLYGITCAKKFAEDPEIIKQRDLNYCAENDSTPACLTHQLMSFRFMQRYGCDRVDHLDDRVHGLQEKIRQKLVMDPRVIDVYLQRVLMLVDSGAADKVKAVWVRRILDEQLQDGSWSWKQRLVYMGRDHYLSFGDLYYVIYPGTAHGTFHTTAQGIWLMSLLMEEKQYAELDSPPR